MLAFLLMLALPARRRHVAGPEVMIDGRHAAGQRTGEPPAQADHDGLVTR